MGFSARMSGHPVEPKLWRIFAVWLCEIGKVALCYRYYMDRCSDLGEPKIVASMTV